MISRKLVHTTIIAIFSIISIYGKSAIDNYDSSKKIFTRKQLNPHYTGPIFSTGGAMRDVNRYIANTTPEKYGEIGKNSITLFDTTNQVYTFKKVKGYHVTKDSVSFTALYLNCRKNREKYEIVIEIIEGPSYNRILWVYKNGIQEIMMLCIDNARLIPAKQELEI